MDGAFVSVVSIPVADQDRAKAFYTGVFGFELVMDREFREGMRWVMLRPPGGGAAITLVTWFPKMRPGSVQGSVLSVPDLDAALSELRRRGAPLADVSVEEAPWGRWITLEDPDGNSWVIQEDRPFAA